jgi:hypothetical protein
MRPACAAALVTVGGRLLRTCSAQLAPAACAPSATPSYVPPGAAEVPDATLQNALLQLLQLLVPCYGHTTRALCESLLHTDCLAPVLGASDYWTSAPEMRTSLLTSLADTMRTRAAFPADEVSPPLTRRPSTVAARVGPGQPVTTLDNP